MDFSSERAFLDQMQGLHAAGYDITVDVGGGTRLAHAANRGWCAAVEFLLQKGADVHMGDENDWTPLYFAANQDRCDAAVLLLDAGARVDARDRLGWTALHLAACRGRTNMCQLLLSRGASLDVRTNNGGHDPEAVARSRGRTATADFLVAVRAAGGWSGYLAAQAAQRRARRALLVLRRALPALRARRAAAPWNDRLLERLFVDVPEDVFTAIFAYWSA